MSVEGCRYKSLMTLLGSLSDGISSEVMNCDGVRSLIGRN